MSRQKASIWTAAPEPGIPDAPALLSDSGNLWLAYLVPPASDNRFAVIRFSGVIDHHLSPINDEGLEEHPYAKAGLQLYSFNEVTGTDEAIHWAILQARHWVITFKDNTLDVLARKVEVVADGIQARDALAALLLAVPGG